MRKLLVCLSFLFFIRHELRSENAVSVIETLDAGVFEYAYFSEALKRPHRFSIVLPSNYSEKGSSTPVLYFLHGLGRDHRSIVNETEARKIAYNSGVVSVFPKGDSGWYLDSPSVEDSKYESMLTELIALCEKSFNIGVQAKDKAICGWSMGGFGSMRYAQTHSGKFKAVAVMIALVDFPNPLLPKEQNHEIPKVMGSDPSYWKEINPLFNIEKMNNTEIALFAAKKDFAYTMNQNFDAKLTLLGIPHHYEEVGGGHSFSVVTNYIPKLYAFILSKIRS